MSKKLFTEKEIKLLSSNKYVKSVNLKGIIYTDEFKQVFIAEKEKGKFARDIFEESGFDVDDLGRQWIKSARRRWKDAYTENGICGLRDTRAGSSGRPRERDLTLEEKNARLEAEINLLKAENELLKKILFAEKGNEEVVLPPSQKYMLIRSVIEKYQLKHMVKYLCEVASVSRSGYYSYFSMKSQEQRKQKDKKDEIVKDITNEGTNEGTVLLF